MSATAASMSPRYSATGRSGTARVSTAPASTSIGSPVVELVETTISPRLSRTGSAVGRAASAPSGG